MCVCFYRRPVENRKNVYDCFSTASGTTHTPNGENRGRGRGSFSVAKTVVYEVAMS